MMGYKIGDEDANRRRN